jgi:DNA-binding response OmpR family regulator
VHYQASAETTDKCGMAERAVVLVAEDEEQLRDPLVHLLRLRGFEVIAAESATEAIDAMAPAAPHAAIVDWNLKQGLGSDVIERIPAATPVIVFSGSREADGIEHLRPSTRFVEKPCSLTWLIDTLNEMLGGGRPAIAGPLPVRT